MKTRNKLEAHEKHPGRANLLRGLRVWAIRKPSRRRAFLTRQSALTWPHAMQVEVQFRWAVRRTIPRDSEDSGMTQKVIDVVGVSKESFAKAAEVAVKEAAKTVRGIKWAHVDSLDMQLDGAKVLQYRATTKIYFDVEH